MADIFISYARQDRERAKILAKALENQGWTVWWDPQIPPGKTFVEVIKSALEEARCAVVLWSEHSVKSEWVQEEATIAKRRGILVPAKLDDVDPPLGFGLVQAADLTDWESQITHLAYDRLIGSISEILGTKIRDAPKALTENDITRRIRTQLLASKTSRELRKNMYDLEQHIVRHPYSPEARLLKDEIQTAINRTKEFELGVSRPAPSAKRIMWWPWLIGSTAVAVVALIIVLYWKLGPVPAADQAKKEIAIGIGKIELQIKQLENEIEKVYNIEDLTDLYRKKEAISAEVIEVRQKAIKAGLIAQINDLQAGLQDVSQKLEMKARQLESIAPKSIKNSIGMEFLLIPAGTFSMGGSPGVGEDDEHPSHGVEISRPFYMQKTEVTQGQWKKIMGNNPSYFENCGEECPVEMVAWEEVQKFIKNLDELEGSDKYRLPTEAEWEYACRAGTSTEYYFGDETNKLAQYAWYDKNSKGRTHRVAIKKPNPLGLYDMHGNVWEWCQDWYDNYYYKNSPDMNPQGPKTGTSRVIRGGSWGQDAQNCRAANRDYWSEGANAFLGFRLTKSVTTAP